jgi:hypothetical protein
MDPVPVAEPEDVGIVNTVILIMNGNTGDTRIRMDSPVVQDGDDLEDNVLSSPSSYLVIPQMNNGDPQEATSTIRNAIVMARYKARGRQLLSILVGEMRL